MSHLLIIELPGGNDVDLLDAVIARGDRFSFLTSRLAHYTAQPAVSQALARAVSCIEVPSFDASEVQRQVIDQHRRLAFDAVLCLIDIRLIEAAGLARTLGVPHIAPETATLLRDKYKVRCRLRDRGLAQPDFALAESNQALRQAVETLGLPVLIKPADGYGSQNIVALRDPWDLDPLLSPLDNLLPSRADYGLGVLANDRLLVERCMTGSVIGCDTLTVDGRHTLLGVNEKLFFEAPSFAIRGGCFTPNGPQFAAIQRQVFAALDAVGFDWGATHSEWMLTDEGPRLIEINARLVGAKIPRLVDLALGRSVHSDLIDVHLGHWAAPDTGAPEQVAVSRWIVADRPGRLDEVQLPTWRDARIRSLEVLKQRGDPVRPPIENADRIACVMVCATSRDEAEALAERCVADSRVRLLGSPGQEH